MRCLSEADVCMKVNAKHVFWSRSSHVGQWARHELQPAKFEVMEDDSFEGTQFLQNDLRTGDVYAVTYKKETLQQLTTAIQNTAAEHGFGPVDPTTLLK